MLNKKADISFGIKTLVIIFITVLIFITYIIILMQASQIHIEEKKLKTQITINSFFTSKCMFEEYGILTQDKYDQTIFRDCFKNKNNDITYRIKLENKADYLYSTTQEDFRSKVGNCNLQSSNQLCTKIVYPIIYVSNDEYDNENLIFEIIVLN